MIYDAENTFLWQKDVTKVGTGGIDSDVVYLGKGDAVQPLWLAVTVSAPLSDDATVTVETSEKETMTGKKTLGTFTLAKGERKLAAKLPVGVLGYVRVHVAAAAATLGAAKMNAVLVLDTDL